jgi:hypothetical protein
MGVERALERSNEGRRSGLNETNEPPKLAALFLAFNFYESASVI